MQPIEIIGLLRPYQHSLPHAPIPRFVSACRPRISLWLVHVATQAQVIECRGYVGKQDIRMLHRGSRRS